MNETIKTPTIGEVLLKEFMEPNSISSYRLAKDINVPVSRIQDILHGRRKLSVDTALRLACYFGVSDRYFMDIQEEIEFRDCRLKLAEELTKIQNHQKNHRLDK